MLYLFFNFHNRHLFLIALEAEKSKIEMPTDSVSVSSWLADSYLVAVSSHGREWNSFFFNPKSDSSSFPFFLFKKK